jgi:pyruvate dehydrogenase E2 component (dihydrolipoamide acetyltransferase)
MPKAIIMPKFGMTQEDATIVSWLVKVGERVEKGDPICEVTTDKVNMEVESTADGILAEILFQEGEIVPVTHVIAHISLEGEPGPTEGSILADQPASPAKIASPEKDGHSTEAEVKATPVARRMAHVEGIDLRSVLGSGVDGQITRDDVSNSLKQLRPDPNPKVRATPAARRLAKQHHMDLADIKGTGATGRVQGVDVQAQVEQQDSVAIPALDKPDHPALASPMETGSPHPTILPLEGIRLTIAQRMQASAQQAPHITLSMDIDMSRAVSMRALLNARQVQDRPQISMTAVLVKACAAALFQYPSLNSHFMDNNIHLYPESNIGVAVALDEGLIVPVVKNAGGKSIYQVGEEVSDLSRRARDKKLRPEDVADGTFTITNLGMFGIDHFTAIINPPQVAILAVGRIATRFVPGEDGRPLSRSLMTVTLSADHRVVDGATAARFLMTLREILESAGTQWG